MDTSLIQQFISLLNFRLHGQVQVLQLGADAKAMQIQSLQA